MQYSFDITIIQQYDSVYDDQDQQQKITPYKIKMLSIITKRFPSAILLHRSINNISKYNNNSKPAIDLKSRPNIMPNLKSKPDINPNPSQNHSNIYSNNMALELRTTVSKQNQFKQKIRKVQKFKEMNRILRDYIGDDIVQNSEIFAITCRYYSKLFRKVNYDISLGLSVIFGTDYQILSKISLRSLTPSQIIDIISTINFTASPIDAYNPKLQALVQQALVLLLSKKSSIDSNRSLSYFCKAARCAEFFGVFAYKDVLEEIFRRVDAIELYQFVGLTNFIFRNRLDDDVVQMEVKIINAILDKIIKQKWLTYCAFNNFCDILQALLQYCNQNIIYKQQIARKQCIILEQAILRIQSQYHSLPQKQLNRVANLFSEYHTPSSIAFVAKLINFQMKQIKPNGQCSINPFMLIKTLLPLNSGVAGVMLRRLEPNWLAKLQTVIDFYFRDAQCKLTYCAFVVLQALQNGLGVAINTKEAKKLLDTIQAIFKTHQNLMIKFQSSLKNFSKPTTYIFKQYYVSHVQSYNKNLIKQQIQQNWTYKFMQLRLCTLFSNYLKYHFYQQSANILKQLSQSTIIQERKNLYFYYVFLELNQSFLKEVQVERVVDRFNTQKRYYQGLDEQQYFKAIDFLKQTQDVQDILVLTQLLLGITHSLKRTAKYKSFLSSLKQYKSINNVSILIVVKYLSFLSIPKYLHLNVIKVLQQLNKDNQNTLLNYVVQVCQSKNVKSREGVLQAELFMRVLDRLWGDASLGKGVDKDRGRLERLRVYRQEEVFIFLCKFARQQFISSLKSLTASNPRQTQLLTLKTLSFLINHCQPDESVKFAQWALTTHSKHNVHKIQPSNAFKQLCILVKDNYLMKEDKFLSLAGKSWLNQKESQVQDSTAIRQIKKQLMEAQVQGKIKEVTITKLYKLLENELHKLQGGIKQLQQLVRLSIYFIKICYQKHKQNPKKLERLTKFIQKLQQAIMLPVPQYQKQKTLALLKIPIYQLLPLQVLFVYLQTTQKLPISPPNPIIFGEFLQQLHSSAWKSKIKVSQLCQLLMQSQEFRKVANEMNLQVLIDAGLMDLGDGLEVKIHEYVTQLAENQKRKQNLKTIITYLEYLRRQIKADRQG